MYQPIDAAGLVRNAWGFDAPAERPVAPPRPHPVRRAYARLWWAARPRIDRGHRTPAWA